jgi:UDP-2,3-diacylglucosamine pyrophosphatase LpxH
MTDKKDGLYTSSSESSFKSLEEIREDNIQRVSIEFAKPHNKSVSEWFEEIERRSTFRSEIDDSYDYGKIEINTDRPAVIGLSGDWHLGATIDKQMLSRDIEIMSEHPLVSGVFLLGDLLESANFNPAEDESILNMEEQRKAMLSILDYIGQDRIFAFWKGNHDHKWERKYGTSKYAGLSEKYNAPVFYGNSYIDMFINDVNYKLMGSHRLRGNSIYNNAHPPIRGHKEVQGLDITFCGHTHKRGAIQQPMREFRGSRMTYGVVSGTYQLGSEYTKDSGFGTQRDAELGMYWLILNHDKKLIRVADTETMLEEVGRYL